jgi:hypothetical protein
MGILTIATPGYSHSGDAPAIMFAGLAGIISVAPDKGSVRTIITGGKRRSTGRFFSAKCGRAMPWEAEHEEPLAFAIAEVETNCLAWLAQPCRVEIPFGSTWLWYIPDLARRDFVGSRWATRVLEFKRDKHEEVDAHPEYKQKLALAEELLGMIGATFEIQDNADLGTPTFRRNVGSIVLDKNTATSPRDIAHVRDIAGSGRAATYGDLCAALGGFIIGKKKVHKLMVQRILAIPLDREITNSTIVSLVDRSRDPSNKWEFFG